MKKILFTLILLVLSNINLYSQHEIKFAIGSSFSNSPTYTDFNSLVNQENPSVSYNSKYSSPRIGLETSIGYAYYINHDIKVFASFSSQQKGYRNQQNFDYTSDWSTSYDYNYSGDSQFNYNYFGSTFGITYVTDFGLTASVGLSFLSLMSAENTYSFTYYYPNNPSLSMSSDDYEYPDGYPNIFDDCYYSVTAPMLGIGYELGNLSIDINYTSISEYGYYDEYDPEYSVFNSYTFEPTLLNSVSIMFGYSHLIIR